MLRIVYKSIIFHGGNQENLLLFFFKVQSVITIILVQISDTRYFFRPFLTILPVVSHIIKTSLSNLTIIFKKNLVFLFENLKNNILKNI